MGPEIYIGWPPEMGDFFTINQFILTYFSGPGKWLYEKIRNPKFSKTVVFLQRTCYNFPQKEAETVKLFSELMLDRPSGRVVGTSACFWMFSFVAIPFFLRLLMIGSYEDYALTSGGQMVYHVFNFLAMLMIFGNYLKDSFLNVEVDTAKVVRTVASSTAIILVFFIGLQTLYGLVDLPLLAPMAWGSLPIGEMTILEYSWTVINFHPLWGSLIMVLLTPLTTSCIYYAMTFAPVCNNKPWLAYVLVAVVLAIPRVINSTLLYWAPEQELAIYLGQLPIHMVACRAYQKCDTVWAPIFTLMVANLFACVYLGLPSLLLGMLQ